MASVQLSSITKAFGTLGVLHDISVGIGDGEFVILVGPSGCGKSTLLRMIAGLEPVSSGEIRIGSRVVNDLPPKDRDIAMVFQNYALYPHMNVAKNMGFSLRLNGTQKGEIASKVAQAAKILGLETLLERYPRQLSGGQRQRVAMGRAIVRNPQVFLFDEPLSNLDAALRVQMRSEIKYLHEQLKTTIVYVTHDQVEAMTMADKIVVMNAGVLEQIGAPLELYDRPRNRFVAGFIGSPSMNFLEGRLEGERIVLDDGYAISMSRRPHAAADGQPIICGVRPEHLALGDGGLSATVAVVEPTGAETHVVAQVGRQKVVAVLRDRVQARGGDRLSFVSEPQNIHLFDKVSGERLN